MKNIRPFFSYRFLILTLFFATAHLQAAQHALTLTSQKPTAEELKQFWAAKYTGDQIIFDLIEKYGENIINEKDEHGESIVYYAASESLDTWAPEKFEKLLQTPGINILIKIRTYGSLLHLACSTILGKDPSEIQLKKVALLIQKGIDVNLKDDCGYSPLMEAARDNQPKVVSILLCTGASTDGYVTSYAHAGKTFFDFAKKHPAVQQAYESYRKELHAYILEQLKGVNDLTNIVEAYLFELSPIDQEAVAEALEANKSEILRSRFRIRTLGQI